MLSNPYVLIRSNTIAFTLKKRYILFKIYIHNDARRE